MIPLRLKECINRAAGRAIFDLSHYLQYQPATLEHTGLKVERRGRAHPADTRRRVALVTPHLGPGGAEQVFLDLARAADRTRTELILIATHSRDSRWAGRWRKFVGHICEIQEPFSEIASATFSEIINWGVDQVWLQNSLYGYAVLPHLRRAMPQVRLIDIVHAADGNWDLASAVRSVAGALDLRVAISDAVSRRLASAGTPVDRIVTIPNGVDLGRYRPVPAPEDDTFLVAFAARLDPVKRPLLLVPIARELKRLVPHRPFRFRVAGDGPLGERLRSTVSRHKLNEHFEFRGMLSDISDLLAGSHVLLVTSSHEGIPLTILESFASGRPVVAPAVGAIEEALTPETGEVVREVNRPEAFARALACLMGDRGAAQQKGAAARRLAESKFDLARTTAAYSRILNSEPGARL